MPTPSILLIPDRYKAAVLYSQIPDSGAVDFDVTRATTAYRTNASGVLESVASGVPRLDYPIGGGCPALLVEPAATNLAILSTDYSGAGWAKTNVTLLEDQNQPDPFGGNDASIIRIDSSGGNIQRAIIGSSSTQYSGAFWIKRIAGSGDCNLRVVENANIVVPVTNEWQRFTATRTSTSTTIRIGVGGATMGDEFAIYQAQLETGSVSTSDIITGGATATRNADVISKTGVSGFIGQLEGYLYAEVDLRDGVRNTAAGNGILEIATSAASRTNAVLILKATSANNLLFGVRTADANTILSSATPYVVGINKIALAYQSGNTVLYVNGVQALSSATAFTFTGAMTAVNLGFYSTAYLNDRIRAAAIGMTRPSNAELAAMTTL
jgi:hypothetical protein